MNKQTLRIMTNKSLFMILIIIFTQITIQTSINPKNSIGNISSLCINPQNPDSSIINYANLPSNLWDLEIDGDFAYVACQDLGLRVINISNPTKMSEVGFLFLNGDIYNIDIEGDLAYVTIAPWGLYVINISDPINPVSIGFVPVYGDPTDIYVHDNYVYVLSTDKDYGIQIINVTNPLSPDLLGWVSTYSMATAIKVAGDYAYIADSYSGIQIFNITDPINPILAGYSQTETNLAWDLELVGNFLYVAERETGLQIFDISNPNSPQNVSICEFGTDLRFIEVSGDYAYLSDFNYDKIQIINISDPFHPVDLQPTNLPARYFDLCIDGDYIYILKSSSLMCYSIRESIEPNYVNSVDVSSEINDLCIEGQIAYFVEGDQGFNILNITNKSNPQMVGELNTIENATSLEINGDYVYITNATSGLQILNITDLTAPRVIGVYDTSGSAMNVKIQGDIAIVADGSTGIHLINITIPSAPKLIESCDTPGYAEDIALFGDIIFVADNSSGIQVINIEDPHNPNIIESLDTPGVAQSIQTSGNFAYLADGIAGIQIINISSPNNIDILGTCDTMGVCRDLEFHGDRLFIVDDSIGVQSINIINPKSPYIEKNIHEKANLLCVDSYGDYIYSGDQSGKFDIIRRAISNAGDYDADGICGHDEVHFEFTVPYDNDTDDDGLSDGDEINIYNTDPLKEDSDADSLPDKWELDNSLNPLLASDNSTDDDSDGILNVYEYYNGTDIHDSDCDDDGLLDGAEIETYHTDPWLIDTDNDQMNDTWEITNSLNPLSFDASLDADDDGLTNIEEMNLGTKPDDADTDNDGYSDNIEVKKKTNPLDPNDFPSRLWLYLIISTSIVIISLYIYLKIRKKARIWKAFISHVVDENEIFHVSEMADYLESRKNLDKCFYCERDLRYNIDKWMEETIPLSLIFIFIFTKKSVREGGDCMKEIGLARQIGIPMIPVKDKGLDWSELPKMNLYKDFRLEFDEEKIKEMKEKLHEFIRNFQDDVRDLQESLRKNKFISLHAIQDSLQFTLSQIIFLTKVLVYRLEKIHGIWTNHPVNFIREDELLRRLKSMINNRNISNFKTLVKTLSIDYDFINEFKRILIKNGYKIVGEKQVDEYPSLMEKFSEFNENTDSKKAVSMKESIDKKRLISEIKNMRNIDPSKVKIDITFTCSNCGHKLPKGDSLINCPICNRKFVRN
ncbi:MAG: hypothetical protein GF364_06965 [Candidatus Lokiarchaeota archaeon]|nr:hypothetical protein [Candidatus Lokiarchaeota archaeon]